MIRIARLETYTDEFVCFVKLTTDDGAVGWGQTSTYNADVTATIFTGRSRAGRWGAMRSTSQRSWI